jgi:hypothetical protein
MAQATRRSPSGVVACLAALAAIIVACEPSTAGSRRQQGEDAIAALIDPNEVDRLSHDAVLQVRATSTLLSRDEVMVSPKDIALVRSTLVVADAQPNPALHVFQLGSPVQVTSRRSIGRRGQGPGEFSSAGSLFAPSAGADELWVYDLNQGRLSLLAGLGTDSGARVIRTVSIVRTMNASGRSGTAINVLPVEVLPVQPTGFLGALQDSAANAFAYFDSTGAPLRITGRFGRPKDDVPAHIGGRAYGSNICYAHGERFAVIFRRLGRIEIRDLNGTLLNDAEVPLSFGPRFDWHAIRQRREIGGPNARVAYSECTATRTHIMALFAGKLRRVFPNPTHVETEFLHVFDWTGAFLGAIRLDHQASSLAVDPAGRYLYTGTTTPDPSIRVSDIEAAVNELTRLHSIAGAAGSTRNASIDGRRN